MKGTKGPERTADARR